MAVAEFEVKGVKYRANRMDARRQLHVAAKIGGFFTAAGTGRGGLDGIGDALLLLQPGDMDFVVNACLAVVERHDSQREAWAPVLSPQGMIMYDDIQYDLAALIQLVAPVIEANVQGFLSAIPNDFLLRFIPEKASS